MTNKVLPTPEKFASCPYDEKILPFYEGQFESVYVMFHPFLKPTSLDAVSWSHLYAVKYS